MADQDQQDSESDSLEGILIDLREDAQQQDDAMTIGDVLNAFSGRAFGPLLAIPAVAIVSPLGMVPTVPSLMGLLVVLVATQRVFGRKAPWVPRRLRERGVEPGKVSSAVDKFMPWAKRIDGWTSSRLKFLVQGFMQRGLAVLAVLTSLTLPPLELLPGAAFLPGAALVLLGLAVVARDGVLAGVSILFTTGALGGVYFAVA